MQFAAIYYMHIFYSCNLRHKFIKIYFLYAICKFYLYLYFLFMQISTYIYINIFNLCNLQNKFISIFFPTATIFNSVYMKQMNETFDRKEIFRILSR